MASTCKHSFQYRFATLATARHAERFDLVFVYGRVATHDLFAHARP
jgi:hypothetical protein